MRLENKVCILTGASSGVGREAALIFAREGAKVYAIARRENRLQELEAEAKEQNLKGEVIGVRCDVSNPEDIEALFNKVEQENDSLDILINNAGVMDDFEPVLETDVDAIKRLMEINVYGAFEMIKHSLKLMKNGGSIVTNASIAGLRGGKAGVGYTMTKHALIGLCRNVAAMYGNDNIRSNVVAPGGIQTEIMESFDNVSEKGMGVIMAGAKVDKMTATAKEVADNLLFFASDESSNINGAVLVSDAGLTNI